MFSFVMPMDSNRLSQFKVTKRLYDASPQFKEFLIMTREHDKVKDYLESHDLMKDVRLIPYEVATGFNPSRAFNIGVRESKWPFIIIMSPEVMPVTDVLSQLEVLTGRNIVCEVSDEDESGAVRDILVTKGYRDESPAFYFLAMFNKKDIEIINGWDETFMEGYAYEDNDFGERWVRAGLPFEIHDEIKGRHQYHPRGETISGGAMINYNHWQDNNARGITRCENGLV